MTKVYHIHPFSTTNPAATREVSSSYKAKATYWVSSYFCQYKLNDSSSLTLSLRPPLFPFPSSLATLQAQRSIAPSLVTPRLLLSDLLHGAPHLATQPRGHTLSCCIWCPRPLSLPSPSSSSLLLGCRVRQVEDEVVLLLGAQATRIDEESATLGLPCPPTISRALLVTTLPAYSTTTEPHFSMSLPIAFISPSAMLSR
jgi:hypothetical protein